MEKAGAWPDQRPREEYTEWSTGPWEEALLSQAWHRAEPGSVEQEALSAAGVHVHLILVLGDVGVDLMQGAHAVELAQVQP